MNRNEAGAQNPDDRPHVAAAGAPRPARGQGRHFPALPERVRDARLAGVSRERAAAALELAAQRTRAGVFDLDDGPTGRGNNDGDRDTGRVLPDGSGVPVRETGDEYLPHLGENIKNARLGGVDRETIAGILETVADDVRAGEYDPDVLGEHSDSGVSGR